VCGWLVALCRLVDARGQAVDGFRTVLAVWSGCSGRLVGVYQVVSCLGS